MHNPRTIRTAKGSACRWAVALAALSACAQSLSGDRRDATPEAPPRRLPGCPLSLDAGRWERMSTERAPSARAFAASVSIGEQLLVWGGLGARGDLTDGALYDPGTDRWEPLPEGPPGGDRRRLVLAALGARAMVWGTYERRGAFYDVLSARWTSLATDAAPRLAQRAVGAVDAWFVWAVGGTGEHNEVALYDPARSLWRSVLPPLSQDARNLSAITWTGREVLVWGGTEAAFSTQPRRNDGYRYDPRADQWSSVASVGAPAPRWGAELHWTGAEALVWGGDNGHQLWDGGLYDPIDDRWRAVPSAASALHVAEAAPYAEAQSAWTSCSLFVWAGALAGSGPRAVLFDPFTAQWRETAPFPGSVAQEGVVVRAVGGSVVVWGGRPSLGPSRAPTAEGWRWIGR